jgi:hypothetical protein
VGKYLAIYHGAASDQQKQELTSEQQDAFMPEAFSTHPHLSLLAENWIEVIECPSLPT